MEPCTIALHDHTGDNVLERLAQANLLCRIVLRVSAGPDQWPHLTAFSSRVRHRMIRSSTEGGTSRLVLCSQTSDIHCPTCTRITRAASVQLCFRCLQRAISLIWLAAAYTTFRRQKVPGAIWGGYALEQEKPERRVCTDLLLIVGVRSHYSVNYLFHNLLHHVLLKHSLRKHHGPM